MNRLIGITLIAVSAASFGTLAIFGRLATTNGIDTYTLLFLRFGLAAVLMAGLLLIRGKTLPRGRNLTLLVGMGAIGYVGQSFCYLTAIQYASPGLVALLLYLYPVFVAILSSLVLHEKITRIKTTALVIALVGLALTINPQGGGLTGILLAITAALIYSVYIIIGTQVLQTVSALQSSTVIFTSAGMVYATLMVFNGPHWPAGWNGWWIVTGIVLIATVIPVVTFLAGLQRIGPTNASMLSTIEPVVTVVLAAVLFKDALTTVTLLGGALILAAVILLTRGELHHSV